MTKRAPLVRAVTLVAAAALLPTCTLIWQADDYTFDRSPCTPGAALPDAQQVQGDCARLVCDDLGATVVQPDENDVPVDDNACTDGVCTDGVPGQVPKEEGSACEGGFCDAEGMCIPSACANGELDGDETDIDCGGETCPQCSGGLMCHEADDCTTGVCTDMHCQYPTCIDMVQNGDETDVDCGGEVCDGCADGLMCLVPADCQSGVCTGGSCAMPVCTDNVVNGDETDMDCGGGTCPDCIDGQSCIVDGDCMSNVCSLEECVPATCDDNMMTPPETDTDCGGPMCSPCPDGDGCMVDSDCQSGICQGNNCQMGGCGDMILNGNETDVDCGGSCGPCGVGLMCGVNGDCVTDICLQGSCSLLNWCDPATAEDLTASSEVTINFQGGGNEYTPPCIWVAQGTTITFSGNFSPHPLEGGRVIQGVKFPDPQSPFWPAVMSGSTASFVMMQSGQFPYYCIPHGGGGMAGVVFVQ